MLKKKVFAVDIDGTITENGNGRIHLDALSTLRYVTNLGHKVIFVSGRSSVEGYLLSVFGGTTPMAVGENGGCITSGPNNHVLLGDITSCNEAYEILKSKIKNVTKKPVFPRMTEVVLERTFDLDTARKILQCSGSEVELSDSLYAFHINSKNVNKGTGFEKLMKTCGFTRDSVIAIGDSETDLPLFEIAGKSIALGNSSEFVKSKADLIMQGKSGDGVIEAMNLLFSQQDYK